MGEYYSMKKEAFDDLVHDIKGDFIAPVKTNKLVLFKKIVDPDLIHLEKKANHPAKSFFFNPKETLFEFKYEENGEWYLVQFYRHDLSKTHVMISVTKFD